MFLGSQADNHRLTVIVVTHNSAATIADCLRPLASGFPVEIIIVDNYSSDGTAELVAEEFPSVRVVSLKQNVGFGTACNLGAARSDTDFQLYLNPDAVASTEAIESLVKFLEEHSAAGIVGAGLVDPQAYPRQSSGEFPSLLRLVFDKPLGLVAQWIPSAGPMRRVFGRLSSKYDLPKHARRVAWVSGAAMCVRREAWEQVGGFDEAIFLYHEDVDLCQRIAKAGWEVWHEPEAVVVHQSGASFAGDRDWQKQEHFRSQGYLIRKHKGKFAAAILTLGQQVYLRFRLYRYLARDRIGRPLSTRK